MGNNFACSQQCVTSCVSTRVEGEVTDKSRRRGYPIADPKEAKMNWQAIAVRHAWRNADSRESDITLDGEKAETENLDVCHQRSSPRIVVCL
uniref:Uncharacterized protein n=1 Tax=Noctiluca scintillans TaxID=2966 RepID=A0A7S1A1K9_NOCSC